MNFNVADLPAVRAQLERDAASQVQNVPQNIPEIIPERTVPPVGSIYPAKQLVLQDGQYRAVDHEN